MSCVNFSCVTPPKSFLVIIAIGDLNAEISIGKLRRSNQFCTVLLERCHASSSTYCLWKGHNNNSNTQTSMYGLAIEVNGCSFYVICTYLGYRIKRWFWCKVTSFVTHLKTSKSVHAQICGKSFCITFVVR